MESDGLTTPHPGEAAPPAPAEAPRPIPTLTGAPASAGPALSALDCLLLLLMSLLGVPALVAFALSLVGRGFGMLTLLGPAVLGWVAMLAAARLRGWRFQADLPELGLGLLSVTPVVAYGIWIALPSLFPVAYSIDLVNHFVLADFIYNQHRLPVVADSAGYIHGMAMYPFAASLQAAIVSWVGGVEPIVTLHPLATTFMASAMLCSYALASRLLTGYPLRRVVAMLAALLLFWPGHYLVRYQFGWSDFFYAQVLGHVWLMSSLYWASRLHARWDRLLVVPLGLSLLAAVLTYTVWLLVPVAGVAATIACCGSVRWSERLKVGVATLAPVLVLLGLYLKDRLKYMLTTAATDGAVYAPATERFGETFIVLAGAGLVVAVLRRRWPLVIFAGILLLQTGAAYLAADARLIGVYWAHKLWYQLVLLMGVALALVVGEHLRQAHAAGLRGRWQAPVAGLLILAALIPAYNEVGRTTLKPPPFGPDHLSVARWANAHLPGVRLTFINMPGVKSYWVHMAMMRLSPFAIRLPNGRESYGYADWLYDAATGEYAYMQLMGNDPLTGADVLYRSGDVILLHRQRQPRPAQADLATVRPDGTGDVPTPLGLSYWLTSARVDNPRPEPGAAVQVHVELMSRGAIDRELLLAAHLRDRAGQVVATTDRPLGKGRPPDASTSQADTIVNLTLRIPPGAPRGAYELELFVLTLPDYQRERPAAGTGAPAPQARVILAPIVVPPAGIGQPPPASARPSGAHLGDAITLGAFELTSDRAGAQPVVRGTLFWQASAPVTEDYTGFIHVLDASGRLVAQTDRQPLAGQYPTTAWRPGEWAPDPFVVTLPADAPAGEYVVVTGMYLLRTGQRLPVAGGGDTVQLGRIVIGR